MHPLVSIIMPAFNAAEYIQKAIDSIINQTYKNWELLIVDDASIDCTIDIVTRYNDPRIRIYRNEENIGYLKSCNKLFDLSAGSFITFQDADDWSDSNRIEKQVTLLQSSGKFDICGTWAKYITLSDTVLREKRTPQFHEDIIQCLKERNPFCGASIMIRKEVYENIGGYKEFFNRIGNEDYDWSLRIIEKYKAYNIPEYLYFVRVTSNSISRTIKSPNQLISHELVHFLEKQRRAFGIDSLTGLDENLLIKFKEQLLQPYRSDKALIYRKAADLAAYNKEWRKVRKNSLMAWQANPFSLINFKYLIGSILRFKH